MVDSRLFLILAQLKIKVGQIIQCRVTPFTPHVTFDVIMKAKQHGVDLLTLPSHTNHEV